MWTRTQAQSLLYGAMGYGLWAVGCGLWIVDSWSGERDLILDAWMDMLLRALF